jgi:hypothetical protein
MANVAVREAVDVLMDCSEELIVELGLTPHLLLLVECPLLAQAV